MNTKGDALTNRWSWKGRWLTWRQLLHCLDSTTLYTQIYTHSQTRAHIPLQCSTCRCITRTHWSTHRYAADSNPSYAVIQQRQPYTQTEQGRATCWPCREARKFCFTYSFQDNRNGIVGRGCVGTEDTKRLVAKTWGLFWLPSDQSLGGSGPKTKISVKQWNDKYIQFHCLSTSFSSIFVLLSGHLP